MKNKKGFIIVIKALLVIVVLTFLLFFLIDENKKDLISEVENIIVSAEDEVKYLNENKESILNNYITLDSYNQVFSKNVDKEYPLDVIGETFIIHELTEQGGIAFIKKPDESKDIKNAHILMLENLSERDIEKRVEEINNFTEEANEKIEEYTLIFSIFKSIVFIKVSLVSVFLFSLSIKGDLSNGKTNKKIQL